MSEADKPVGHGAKLPRKQEAAISALLLHPTVAAAASVAGVGERTLRGWMKLRDFQRAYFVARQGALQQATAALHRASSSAVSTLESVMADKDAPASARVTAARAVLDLAFRSMEFEELEMRDPKPKS